MTTNERHPNVPRDKSYWQLYTIVSKKYPTAAKEQLHAITYGIKLRTMERSLAHV